MSARGYGSVFDWIQFEVSVNTSVDAQAAFIFAVFVIVDDIEGVGLDCGSWT